MLGKAFDWCSKAYEGLNALPAKLFPKAVFCPRRVVAGAVAAKLLP